MISLLRKAQLRLATCRYIYAKSTLENVSTLQPLTFPSEYQRQKAEGFDFSNFQALQRGKKG